MIDYPEWLKPFAYAALPELPAPALAKIYAARERYDAEFARAEYEYTRTLKLDFPPLRARPRMDSHASEVRKRAITKAAERFFDVLVEMYLPLTSDTFLDQTLQSLVATVTNMYVGRDEWIKMRVDSALKLRCKEWRARCWERQAALITKETAIVPGKSARSTKRKAGRPPALEINGTAVKKARGELRQADFVRGQRVSVDVLQTAENQGRATEATIRAICRAAKAKGVILKPEDLKKHSRQKPPK